MTRQITINISEITETFDVYSLDAAEKAKIIKAQADALKKADAKITRLRAENEKLRSENEKLVAQSWVVDGALLSECEENEKLRAAKVELLRLFDEAMDGYADCMPYKGYYLIEKHGDKENFDDLRAAAAALKETGDE